MCPVAIRRFVVLWACVPALALAACGGGHSTAGTLTKPQYDAKVNRLCLVAADQLRELHLDNTVAAWKHEASNIVHIDEHFDDALGSLQPPPSIAKAVVVFRHAYEKLAQDAKDGVAAARAGDQARLRAAIAAENKDNAATYPLAKAIGATGCYVG
jgi:hypothetical protein